MKIRLYDMKFGESIFIQDDCIPSSKGILVDCGSLEKNIKFNSTYDTIYNDIQSLNPDVLITHFHQDHISGLIYFAKNKKPVFNNLYIPDIFNLGNSLKIITLVLIDFLLQSYQIFPNNPYNLYDLALGLCSTSKNVKFLKRGVIFRDNYIALTPFDDDLDRCADSLYDDLGPISQDWNIISRNFLKAIMNKANGEIFYQNLNIPYNLSISGVKEDIERLSKNESSRKSLNSFGHKINIVFQNNKNSQNIKNLPVENILFTGDAEINQLNKLKKLGDFYDRYEVYKIPHHGTKAHLFKDIDSNKAIISHAQYCNSSWNICSDYHSKNYCFYCTNCNGCNERLNHQKISNYCKVNGNYLVFPNMNIII